MGEVEKVAFGGAVITNTVTGEVIDASTYRLGIDGPLVDPSVPRHCANCPASTERMLCERCHVRLKDVLTCIDPAIAYLDRIADLEAENVGSPLAGSYSSGAKHAAHASDPLPPAAKAANDLNDAAENWARFIRRDMAFPPAWNGQPGSYLLKVAEYIANQPWAPGLMAEFETKLRRIRRQWPRPEDPVQPRLIPNVPCPACHLISLYLYPAQYPGQPIAIACDCGWRNHQDAQTWLHSLYVLAEEAQKARAKGATNDGI